MVDFYLAPRGTVYVIIYIYFIYLFDVCTLIKHKTHYKEHSNLLLE